MNMRIGSFGREIRAYADAQIRNAQRALPETSRSVVLRLPVDSIDLSPVSRALQKGRLRVGLDSDGSGQYTKVTNENTNPVMSLLEEGMNSVKGKLDEMKKLTELMKDEEMSSEDRYAAQIQLVELEGELEKNLRYVYERYAKMANDQELRTQANLWDTAKGQASQEAVLDAGWRYNSENFYIADRVTGDMFGFKKYSEMIDKRTQLRKEAIERIRMRELDPEAFEKYEEELRETLRTEFRAKADENGNIRDTSGGAKELKEITFSPGMNAAMYSAEGFAAPQPSQGTGSRVALSYADLRSADGFVRVLFRPRLIPSSPRWRHSLRNVSPRLRKRTTRNSMPYASQ